MHWTWLLATITTIFTPPNISLPDIARDLLLSLFVGGIRVYSLWLNIVATFFFPSAAYWSRQQPALKHPDSSPLEASTSIRSLHIFIKLSLTHCKSKLKSVGSVTMRLPGEPKNFYDSVKSVKMAHKTDVPQVSPIHRYTDISKTQCRALSEGHGRSYLQYLCFSSIRTLIHTASIL